MSGNFDSNYGGFQASHPVESHSFSVQEGLDQFGNPGRPNVFINPNIHGATEGSQTSPSGRPSLAINLHYGPNFFGTPGLLAESPQQGSPNVANFLGVDKDQSPVDTKPSGRIRRKNTGDQVKHRRTRSGCYTCRSRRVKCDEKRPTCERCRKGSRDCVYPEPKTKKKSSAAKSAAVRKGSTESGSEDDDSDAEELEDLPDESPPSNQAHSRPPPALHRKKRSESHSGSDRAPSKSSNNSPLATKPPTPNLGMGSMSQGAVSGEGESSPSTISPDQQFYLDYYQHTLTHHHYQFKHDSANFVRDTLYQTALLYSPLRYAVVGFAAFHYTVNNPEGKIADFLVYYNQSVSLLRTFLQEGHEHTDAMLYTILQLATFEEYLGDWVNLFGHQRAAHEMFLELYTPDSLATTPTRRTLFTWYARFDLFAGLMAGNETTLGIEWARANERGWQAAVDADPENLDNRIQSLSSSHRVLGVEMAHVNARHTKGETSASEYMQGISAIRERISFQWGLMDRLFENEDCNVPVHEISADPLADEIIGPVQHGQILKGPLFSLNYMRLDWTAIDAMSQYQLSIFLKQPAPQRELFDLAVQQMRVIDRMWRWKHLPNGAMIPTQASLGLLSLLMPAEERYTRWCRQKLAMIECHGYIYPHTVRAKLTQAWSMPSLHHWWLQDEDSCPPIIRSLRAFIDERTTKPQSQVGEDIRAMRAMFQRVGFGDEQRRNRSDTISATGTIAEEELG